MTKKTLIDLIPNDLDKPVNVDFKGFIGQKPAVTKLKFFILSDSEETPFPTLLLSGSHGLGKTYLAEKTAKGLNRRFVSVNCGEVRKKDDFITRVLLPLTANSCPTTIFMDESHSLSNEITTLLLTLLNPNSSMFNTIDFEGYTLKYDLSKINMIFATTDAHAMFNPLKNRCEIIYFYPYDTDEILSILNFYLEDIDILSDPVSLSEACRNRARDAFVLSQNIKRYCNLNSLNYIDDSHWSDFSRIFDIRAHGLRREEVELLRVVADSGPISCSNIALRLMVNEENVKSELEIRLRELGMISSTTKGRILTKKGKEYVNDCMD